MSAADPSAQVEASDPVEPLGNPYEGMDIFESPPHELALADMADELAHLDEGTPEHRLLDFQIRYIRFSVDDAIRLHIKRKVEGAIVPDEGANAATLKSLAEERQAIMSEVGIDPNPLIDDDVHEFVSKRATSARWALSGLNHDELEANPPYAGAVSSVEREWADAASKARRARIASIHAEVARLDSEQHVHELATGTELENFKEKRIALYADIARESFYDRGDSGPEIGGGWSMGVPTR